MAKLSNLPVVLIENDREKDADGSRGRPQQQFHWDSLKTLYNGGSLRTMGVKTGGNETYTPQFKGGLVISQNNRVAASHPVMERLIHLEFDKSHHSEAGREAAQNLSRMATSEVSAFLLNAVTQEEKIMGVLEEHSREFEKIIAEAGVKNMRIQKNYGQVLALISALRLVTPITQSQRVEASQLLVKLARERDETLQSDHPIVERFWEAFDYLNEAGEEEDEDCHAKLNHSREPGVIAVNLNHFVEVAANSRQQIPDLSDLKKYLKTSKKRKFIDSNVVTNSAINARFNSKHGASKPASIRCWIFSLADGNLKRSKP